LRKAFGKWNAFLNLTGTRWKMDFLKEIQMK
jgi:hypothetical protein